MTNHVYPKIAAVDQSVVFALVMTDYTFDYDAIVCGAGPSGATVARRLAEQGFRVALIDKGKFPRDKVCGGALRQTLCRSWALIHRLSIGAIAPRA